MQAYAILMHASLLHAILVESRGRIKHDGHNYNDLS
jgi:hypothetical protein